MDEFALRVLFSNGGAFLVTGYRGVGKTSFINQVVKQLIEAEHWAKQRLGMIRIVPIPISLPRKIEPITLMHHLVRRLYEKLRTENISELLNAQVQKELHLAYQRTFFSLSASTFEGRDITTGKEFGFTTPLQSLGVKIPFEQKTSRSNTNQASYLAYDSSAAEYDLIRLSEKITSGYSSKNTLFSRILAKLHRKSHPCAHTSIKIIFVFDELDKIDSEQIDAGIGTVAGTESGLNDVFMSLKTLFTTSGLTFIFVAGKDLHDRWLVELGRGESVLESVFSFDKYLACIWSDVREMCEAQVDLTCLTHSAVCPSCRFSFEQRQLFCVGCGRLLKDLKEAKATYEAFIKYVSYVGRGIPRRVIRCFNSHVKWIVDRPVLAIQSEDLSRIKFFSELWDTLVRQERMLITFPRAGHSAEYDRLRLAVYYLTDWIIGTEGESFTGTDALLSLQKLSAKIVPAKATEQTLLRLIDVLLKADFIEQARKPGESVVNGLPLQQESDLLTKNYRLCGRRVNQLGAKREGSSFFGTPNDVGQPLNFGDYLVERSIGSGSMGKVYLARHRMSGKQAAVKTVNGGDPEITARFAREGAILESLNHKNIVRFLSSGTESGHMYIAMEFIDGPSLRDVILQGVPKLTAFYIVLEVASALEYLHSNGMVRNDIKPSNILLSRDGRVVMVDFGITRSTQKEFGDLTAVGRMIGTPNYMAPEQILAKSVDGRADIFALGLVLFELLSGRHPFQAPFIPDRIIHSMPDDLPIELGLTEIELSIVGRCLAKDPNERYDKAAELCDDLKHSALSTQDGQEAIRALLFNVHSRANSAEEATRFPQVSKVKKGEFTQEVRNIASVPYRNTDTNVGWGTVVPGQAHIEKLAGNFGSTIFDADAGNRQLLDIHPTELNETGTPESRRQPISSKERPREPAGYGTMLLLTPLRGTLAVLQGPSQVGRYFQINEPRTRIGRSLDNEVVLDGAEISRYHAEIIRDTTGLWLRDLGSESGILLDGEKIDNEARLAVGQNVQIGRFELRVDINGSSQLAGS